MFDCVTCKPCSDKSSNFKCNRIGTCVPTCFTLIFDFECGGLAVGAMPSYNYGIRDGISLDVSLLTLHKRPSLSFNSGQNMNFGFHIERALIIPIGRSCIFYFRRDENSYSYFLRQFHPSEIPIPFHKVKKSSRKSLLWQWSTFFSS